MFYMRKRKPQREEKHEIIPSKSVVAHLSKNDLQNPQSASQTAKSITKDELKESYGASVEAALAQKKKDAIVKAGLQVITEKKAQTLVPARIRYNNTVTVNRSIDERLAHVRYLQYEAGEDIFNMQYTTIHKAAMDGDFLGVKYFLDRTKTGKASKVNVDDYDRIGWCPIHYAAAKNQVEILELLVLCGCDVNVLTADHMSAMIIAGKYGHVEALNKLFYLGGDLMLKSRNDTTIAHYAAQNNHGSIILQLIELYRIYKPLVALCALENIDEDDRVPSVEENLQTTHFTIEQLKQLEVAMSHIKAAIGSGSIDPKMVKHSTDYSIINSPTKNGICPLHLAAENDCADVIDAFVKHVSSYANAEANGAGPTEANQPVDVNPRDSVGESPLHKAGRNKHSITYRKLVEIGASESILNMLKQTPKQLLIDDIIL